MEVPSGWVHRDVPGIAFRAAVGFSIDPSEWTDPLNKLVVNQA
jgi:hypothetical protein